MPRAVSCIRAAIAVLAVAGVADLVTGQAEPSNGMRPADLRCHAIVGARVVVAPGRVLEEATIVIRDGLLEAVGAHVTAPSDARIWPGEGLTVYPGLIDAAVLVEPVSEPESPGDHWNQRIHPELVMARQAVPGESLRRRLREIGFTAAAVYPESGILRGTGAVVALADDGHDEAAYLARGMMIAGVSRGRGRGRGYPGSQMGVLAVLRQTLHDARWHLDSRRVWAQYPESGEPPARADALEALEPVVERRQRLLVEVGDEHEALRAARLADELDLDMVLLGSGLEFRRLPEIAATGLPVIVPLSFPDRPALESLASAGRVTLREMMTWEQAPTNPRRLLAGGATIAITTHRLKKHGEFHGRLARAVKHGLSEDDALAALTTVPASLLDVDHLMGTVEAGKIANLLVVEGLLFEKKPTIRDVWIDGRRHEISSEPSIRLVAEGTLATDLGSEHQLTVDTVKKTVAFQVGDDKVKARSVVVQQDQLSFVVDGRPFGVDGYVRCGGALTSGQFVGSGALPDGRRFAFTFTPGEQPESEGEGEHAEATGNAGEPTEEPSPTDVPEEAVAADRGDDVSGSWTATIIMDQAPEPMPASLELALDESGSITGTISVMGEEVQLEEGAYDRSSGEARFSFDGPHGGRGILELVIGEGGLQGTVTGDNVNAQITAHLAGGSDGGDPAPAGERDQSTPDAPFQMPPEELAHPLGAYGLAEPPQQQRVLVRGGTIWTAGPDGIIADGLLAVEGGRIVYVGPRTDLDFDADVVIDARGRHVTPGLIDCHSHTGIAGSVNEMGQTNTAEVRIGDVIDPDDINWYRQLAGGLTAANLLHGSANPIGGQNAVVKLRWGGGAADFPVIDAVAGIKFALGENVVRSSNRYPNTRMGVETFIRDAFIAAQDYREAWDRYLALPSEQRRRTRPPRRDLELEALVEILDGQRLVHCHSYRQDEILMLIRLAEELGFTIGTFQHVLEGYKVAEAIAAHGAGASSFSDWWAYKVEVMDAIPFNGSLMTDVGVLVSFNSDSSELARRLNTEAAKAVRYGGMDRHEALKLVCLNPARQLRIDHRTGSLEAGKDADFAIWSDDPLSTYARCEQTWIDGACHFSLEQDRQLRERDAAERQRLVQKILSDAHGAAPVLVHDDEAQPDDSGQPTSREQRMVEARRRWMEQQVRLGHDPEEIRPGQCGDHDHWLETGAEEQE